MYCGEASVVPHVVEQIAPNVVLLEIGTNDLVDARLEVVGSEIVSLVCHLLEVYKVPVFGVFHVIPCGQSHDEAASFVERVEILQQYLEVVLSPIPNVFCWLPQDFSHPGKDFYMPDGVNLNPAGQYHLYRSYRGASGPCACYDTSHVPCMFVIFHTFHPSPFTSY